MKHYNLTTQFAPMMTATNSSVKQNSISQYYNMHLLVKRARNEALHSVLLDLHIWPKIDPKDNVAVPLVWLDASSQGVLRSTTVARF